MRRQYVLVKPSDNGFNIAIVEPAECEDGVKIGNFYRISDDTHFDVYGIDIYKGEVDETALSNQLAEFLGLGKRLA